MSFIFQASFQAATANGKRKRQKRWNCCAAFIYLRKTVIFTMCLFLFRSHDLFYVFSLTQISAFPLLATEKREKCNRAPHLETFSDGERSSRLLARLGAVRGWREVVKCLWRKTITTWSIRGWALQSSLEQSRLTLLGDNSRAHSLNFFTRSHKRILQ